MTAPHSAQRVLRVMPSSPASRDKIAIVTSVGFAAISFGLCGLESLVDPSQNVGFSVHQTPGSGQFRALWTDVLMPPRAKRVDGHAQHFRNLLDRQ